MRRDGAASESRFSGDAAQDLLQEQLAKSDRVREEALNALQCHVSGGCILSIEAAGIPCLNEAVECEKEMIATPPKSL